MPFGCHEAYCRLGEMMTDKYRNFRKLSDAELLNVDYRIRCRPGSVPVAIVAPHGGKIEKGTSAIAEAIAGDTYALYCFEGMKPRNNRDLHITSTHFNEPECLELISTCDVVVTVHGCQGSDQTVKLGGLDDALRNAIREKLEDVGFATAIDPKMEGHSKDNICNRSQRGKGVQLEFSKGLRKVLERADSAEGTGKLSALATAVRSAIDETLA